MLKINDFNDRINITVTKEDLLFFAEQVIQKYTEQNQDTKFPERMTIPQVARYLNYSEASIYKMVGSSSIPCYKPTQKGKILFKKTEINEWMGEGKQLTVSDFCNQQDRAR